MRILTTLCFICLFFTSFAQQNKQSAIALCYTHQLPIGNLADQFGDNSSIGFSIFKEKENNLFYGIEVGYLFSNNIRDTSIFDNISTSTGAVIGADGTYSNINLMQRGFDAHAFVGYAYHPKKNNLSGVYISGGVGFLQHQIFIDTKNQNIPQLNEEYKKGYNSLTNGVSTKWEASYKFYSPNGKFQMYAGMNMTIAYTKNKHPYLFDKEEYTPNTGSWDNLLGVNVGIIIPIHRKNEEEFHYY
tara:strand:- start:140 stop:871 length:732 start_codon:yes stop_codon:yes gene_type:complete